MTTEITLKRGIAFFICLLFCGVSFAQNRIVTGKITEKFNEVHLILHGFPVNGSSNMNGQQLKTSGSGEEQSVDFKNANGKISVKW